MLGNREKAWLSGVITVYLQCRQYQKAQPLLELLVELYPNDPRPVKQLAYLHYQQGSYEHALVYCNQCLNVTQDEQDARVHLLKSFCHLKSGSPDLARDAYRRFNELRNTP